MEEGVLSLLCPCVRGWSRCWGHPESFRVPCLEHRPRHVTGQLPLTRSRTLAGRSPPPSTASSPAAQSVTSRGATKHRQEPPQPADSCWCCSSVTHSHHVLSARAALGREYHSHSTRLVVIGSGCHSNRQFILGTSSSPPLVMESASLQEQGGQQLGLAPLGHRQTPGGHPAARPRWVHPEAAISLSLVRWRHWCRPRHGDALRASPQAALGKEAAGKGSKGDVAAGTTIPSVSLTLHRTGRHRLVGGARSSRGRCSLVWGGNAAPAGAWAWEQLSCPAGGPSAPAAAASPARRGTQGAPRGWQEPPALTHERPSLATSLSFLKAALFEKLFIKTLQAVKGDPRAFSKLTAHSFLEKGVKNKQISKRKKAGSLLTACGGFATGQLGERKVGEGGFGQVPPAPAPLSPAPAAHRCGFPWKPQCGPEVPNGASPAPAPAAEGASTLATTAPEKPSPRKATERNAQRALGTARPGTRGAASPQTPWLEHRAPSEAWH